MKCPKCGYNSFDHLESCKKCGGDLAGHKTRFGLRSLFFGGGTPEPEPAFPEPVTSTQAQETMEAFSDETVASVEAADSGFDFGVEAETEESPFEASLDELLGVGVPAETEPDGMPGDVAGSEGLPGFDPGGIETACESAATEAFPEALDPQPASELSQEGLEGFAFDDDSAAPKEPETMGDSDPAESLPGSPAADLFSWEDGSGKAEEELHSPDENLAELFLDSLDEGADPALDLPPVFAGEDPFGDISSDLEVVEREIFDHEEDGDETGSGEYGVGEDESSPPENRDAPPLTSRIGAGVADLLILAAVFVLFLAAGEVALGPDQGSGLYPSLTMLLQLAIPYFLVLFAVCFGYFTLFHFLLGQTPGKMLFRIRVVGEEGDGLMFSQAFLRSVGGLLSLLPAGLGYLGIPLDRERRGWNDRLANSRVIRQAGWESPEKLSEGETEEG